MLTFRADDPDDEYYFPEWSPDGSQIVFNVGQPQEWYHLAVASADGGDVVAIGPTKDWDAGALAAFSPDASKAIARYNDGSIWLLDTSGAGSSSTSARIPAELAERHALTDVNH